MAQTLKLQIRKTHIKHLSPTRSQVRLTLGDETDHEATTTKVSILVEVENKDVPFLQELQEAALRLVRDALTMQIARLEPLVKHTP